MGSVSRMMQRTNSCFTGNGVRRLQRVVWEFGGVPTNGDRSSAIGLSDGRETARLNLEKGFIMRMSNFQK